MIVAFCGHSTYVEGAEDENKVIEILETVASGSTVDFFPGEYGAFDCFAYKCAKKFKAKYKSVKLIYVTPYLSFAKRDDFFAKGFDQIIYPEIESVPLKYAIVHRNRWIADQADVIIAYVKRVRRCV